MKEKIVNIWENNICEGVNRRALKKVMLANKLWHKGGIVRQFISIKIHNRIFKSTGCEIYPQAEIGSGLYIPHFVGIVVGNTTEIGKNCVLFPNVVFGAAYSPTSKKPIGRRHPKVGDNCVFGANSSIIGKITIGNNVFVGAGSIITKDVPNNAIVVGENRIIGYKEV